MRHDKTSHTISWISSSVRVARFLSLQLPQKRKQIRKIVTPFCKGPLFEKPQSAYLADRLSIHSVKCEQRRIERGVIKNDRVVGAVAISQKLFIGIGFVCHPGICRQAY